MLFRSVLECCGTAGGKVRMRAAPELAYLPGLAPGSRCSKYIEVQNGVYEKWKKLSSKQLENHQFLEVMG